MTKSDNVPWKGLGKSGSKRQAKVVQESFKGITIAQIRRLARQGGVKRLPGVVYEKQKRA